MYLIRHWCFLCQISYFLFGCNCFLLLHYYNFNKDLFKKMGAWEGFLFLLTALQHLSLVQEKMHSLSYQKSNLFFVSLLDYEK